MRDAAAFSGIVESDVGLQRRHVLGALVGDEPVDQPRVVRGDPVGVERPAGPASGTSAVGPFSTCPRTSGETATTGAAAARTSSPSTARIGSIEITGLDGPMTIARASRSAASASGVRGRGRAAELDVLDRAGRLRADHELLELVPAAGGLDVRAHRLVARHEHARRHAERAPQVVDRLA